MSLMICRGHIRTSKGAFKIFVIDGPMKKFMLKSNFSLLSSFWLQFQRVVNWLGPQKLCHSSM